MSFDVPIYQRMPRDSFSHVKHPSQLKVKPTVEEYEQEKLIQDFLKSIKGKQCKECKKPLLNKRKSIKFCSLSCAQHYTWKNKRRNERCHSKKCAYCINLFVPKRNIQIYCSTKCANDNRPKPTAELVNFLSGMVSAGCLGCGRTIMRKGYKKYCSKKCRARVATHKYYYKCKRNRIEKIQNSLDTSKGV